MLTIRPEEPRDISAIRALHRATLKRPAEDGLRCHCKNRVSLVAEAGGAIVGHILLSPVWIEGEHGIMGGMQRIIGGMGLVLLAIHPDMQQQGIGSSLVRKGVEAVASLGSPFILVQGLCDYYPRFGFKPAKPQGIFHPHLNSDLSDTLLILTLDKEVMSDVQGVVHYRVEYDLVGQEPVGLQRPSWVSGEPRLNFHGFEDHRGDDATKTMTHRRNGAALSPTDS